MQFTRTNKPILWPLGFEAMICFASSMSFFLLLFVFRKLETNGIDNQQKANITFGLFIGLLWTIDAGAIMHLYIIGLLFGLFFGILGGFLGKGFRLLVKRTS